jgi:hypothetical protein
MSIYTLEKERHSTLQAAGFPSSGVFEFSRPSVSPHGVPSSALVLAPADHSAPGAKHPSRYPAIEACLEVARLMLLAILFPTGVLVFLMGPFAFIPIMLVGLIYPIYLAVDALEKLAAGPA